MELEEYINLEQRVSGRMVLLDISATGEENLIEQQSGNQMNDLEYRRKQLLKLQETVIDLEELSSGVSIADLTLTDFRIDLARFLRDINGSMDRSVGRRPSESTNRSVGFSPRETNNATSVPPRSLLENLPPSTFAVTTTSDSD